MFSKDGEPLLSSDKAKILHAIESMIGSILDGMALVSKVHKDEEVKTWNVFSSFLPEC